MVFCNTLDSCRAVDHFLRDRGFDPCCCHGDVPLDGRKEAIRRFTSQDEDLSLDQQPVLVCTDLAARCSSYSESRWGGAFLEEICMVKETVTARPIWHVSQKVCLIRGIYTQDHSQKGTFEVSC